MLIFSSALPLKDSDNYSYLYKNKLQSNTRFSLTRDFETSGRNLVGLENKTFNFWSQIRTEPIR